MKKFFSYDNMIFALAKEENGCIRFPKKLYTKIEWKLFPMELVEPTKLKSYNYKYGVKGVKNFFVQETSIGYFINLTDDIDEFTSSVPFTYTDLVNMRLRDMITTFKELTNIDIVDDINKVYSTNRPGNAIFLENTKNKKKGQSSNSYKYLEIREMGEKIDFSNYITKDGKIPVIYFRDSLFILKVSKELEQNMDNIIHCFSESKKMVDIDKKGALSTDCILSWDKNEVVPFKDVPINTIFTWYVNIYYKSRNNYAFNIIDEKHQPIVDDLRVLRNDKSLKQKDIEDLDVIIMKNINCEWL